MARTTKRISMTIPSDLVDDVDFICHALGVSRSVYISEVLKHSSTPIREIYHQVFPDGINQDTLRKRDPALVRDQLKIMLKEFVTVAQEEIDSIGVEHGGH